MSFKVSNSIPVRANNKSINGLVSIQKDVDQSSNNPYSSFCTFISATQNVSGAFGNLETPRNVIFPFVGFGDGTLLNNNSPVSMNSTKDIFTFSQSGVYDVSFTLSLAKTYPIVTPPSQTSAINTQSYIIINNPDGTLKWRSAGFINNLFISQLGAGVSTYTNGLSTSSQRVIIKGIKPGDTLSIQTKNTGFIYGIDGNYQIFQGGTLSISKR